MANRSGVPGLWPAGRAALSPEGALVTASLVLIFGGPDLTRGADPASAGISWTAVSLVLTWGGSGPTCGAGCTSGRGSSCIADSLVLICFCFIRSPEVGLALSLSDGPALAPPSLVETASCVLIRGRSRGGGSCGEGGSVEGCGPDGDSGRGGSAESSCAGGSAAVRGSSSGIRPLADFFFFRRASTPRRVWYAPRAAVSSIRSPP